MDISIYGTAVQEYFITVNSHFSGNLLNCLIVIYSSLYNSCMIRCIFIDIENYV